MNRPKFVSLGVLLTAALLAGRSEGAKAATIENSPFAIDPLSGVAAGADRAVWFSIADAAGFVRVTPDFSYRRVYLPAEPRLPDDDGFLMVTQGTDHSLWVTSPERGSVFRLRPDGTSTEYPVQNRSPYAIALGPDGNIWFTAPGVFSPTIATPWVVGRITNDGQLTLFPVPAYATVSGGITGGPDGNLWIAVEAANKIVRLTLKGQATEFPLPKAGSKPRAIQRGTGGDLWFTEFAGNRIGRITTKGVITEYDLPHPGSQPESIVQAPDGNMWFTEAADIPPGVNPAGNRIGRITAQGAISELAVPGSFTPLEIAVGPDGNLWFSELYPLIGRVTLGGTPGPCVPEDTVLCIDDAPGDRRFKVEVEYSTTQGGGFSGNGHAVPLASLGVNRGGLFWFFSADNPELLVKVLDGCSANGSRWVFLSGGTNVGLIATVRDTATNEVHTYYNKDLTPFAPVQDTKALSCAH